MIAGDEGGVLEGVLGGVLEGLPSYDDATKQDASSHDRDRMTDV